MSPERFIKEYTYDVADDFVLDGVPASWAEDGPLLWGEETAKIQLPKVDSSRSYQTGCVALSPDESLIAVSIEHDAFIYDFDSKELLQTLKGHTETIKGLGFYEDKTGLCLFSSGGDAVHRNDKIIFWKIGVNRKIESIDDSIDVENVVSRAVQTVSDIVIKEHGWNVPEVDLEELTKAFRKPLEIMNAKHKVRNNTILSGEEPILSRDGQKMLYMSQNSSTQDGARATELLPQVIILDLATKTVERKLVGHTDHITWANFSHDANLVASVSWDETAKIWNVSTGALIHIFGPTGGQNWSGAFSPDSKYFAFTTVAGSPDQILVHNIQTGQKIAGYRQVYGMPRPLAWSGDGRSLAFSDHTAKVTVINPLTGEEKLKWQPKADHIFRSFLAPTQIDWLDDGTKLMFNTGTGGTIEIWHTIKNVKWRFARPQGYGDGKFYAMPPSVLYAKKKKLIVSLDKDRTLRFWDLKTAD